MPDLLMKFPEGDKTTVVLKLSYLPDESVLKLEAKRKFSDFPFYEISGMRYQVDFLMEDTKDVLLSTKITLYADMYVEMFENVKNHITMRFNAVYGDVTAEVIDDRKKGGFVFRRGLDEFLDEGFNDYLCRQLGHGAFGSGLVFYDLAHRHGVSYAIPKDDGVLIFME